MSQQVNIESLRVLPDFAQVTKWDMQFITFPLVGAFGSLIPNEYNLRCESIELPKGNMSNVEVQLRGHKVFNSGLMDYGNSMVITFVETEDNMIMKLVKAWREISWGSRTGRQFSKRETEATLLITRLDKQDNPIAKYTMYGCIYQSDDFGTLDGSSSDAIKPQLTLNFDYFVDAPLR